MKDVSDSISVFNGNYPGGVNVTSVVYHAGRDAFVFDSLLYLDDTHSLLQSMTRLGLKARGLINTHWHIDHTAGNQLFLDTHRIISHSLCGHLMRTEGRDDPGWANGRLKLDGKDRVRGTYPNEATADRSTLQLGRVEMEVLHAPGHTPDSIIGSKKDEAMIIAGDTVIEITFIGYGNSAALVESLRKIQSIAGNKGRLIQGHGGI